MHNTCLVCGDHIPQNEMVPLFWILRNVNTEIFANSVKKHVCDAKNSRLGLDLPISVSDRVIAPFCEDFVFTKLRVCFPENKTLTKIS